MNIIATDFEHKKIRDDAKTVGIVSGTFAPFHSGHKRVVDAARKENDLVIVIVGGHDSDRGCDYGFPQKERYKRLRCSFENDENVMVAMLNEDKTYDFADQDGLEKYHDGVCEIVSAYAPNCETIRNYVGQQDYFDIVDAAYPDFETVLVRRSLDSRSPSDNEYTEQDVAEALSATAIRSNPFEYWNYIDDAFKYRYRRCYVFAGAMSTGKSTISSIINDIVNSSVLALASELNDNVGDIDNTNNTDNKKSKRIPKGSLLVLETARFYTEGWRHIIESDLNERDYLAFIDGQLRAMEDAKMSASDEQIAIIDTDGVITKQYIENDDEAIREEYADSLSKVCDISVEWTRENADLVFILPNDVEFELDGSRDGHIEEKRDEFRQQVIERYERECPRRVVLVPEGDLDEKIEFILQHIIDDFSQ